MIDPSTYTHISDLYADIYDSGFASVDELTAMSTALNNTNASQTLKDSLSPSILSTTKVITFSQEQPSTNILKSLYNLQKTITVESGSVDNYLETNLLTVKQSFASFSALVGFTISNANIEG